MSLQFGPRIAPHFFVNTIHQVIWPGPGTLSLKRVQGLGQITWRIVQTNCTKIEK